MNSKERLELARWAASQAKKYGANEASVNIVNSRDIEILHHDGKLENLKESTQNSLTLYVYANQRYSGHSTNDIRRESLSKFITDAVDMTKYLSEDPYRNLPDPKYYQGLAAIDLKLRDDAYESVESNQRVKIARDLEEAIKAQSDKVVSCSGEYGDTYAESVKVNTNGFEGEETGTYFYSGVELYIEDDKGGRLADYAVAYTRHFKDLPTPDELAKEAVTRVNKKIGQSKIESGVYDMLVENRAARGVIYNLYNAMGGRALQQRATCLEGKLDKQIASEKLTLNDDPLLPGGLGSQLYDSEGMAAKKRMIIDKGIFKDFFISSYYARKLETEPTTASYSNMIVSPGTRSLEEIIKSMEKGIYVTSFVGGNSNQVTGDYSFGIVGLLVENGQIIKPVNEMNITGNLLKSLMDLEEIGNDPYMYSSRRIPSLYFKNIQFSGV
jgi:PmbA protein